MLALLVADREERLAPPAGGPKSARKTELVLAASGLSPAEIAPLVGKNLAAVQKTIQRGGK
jgi:DNA-directed RNA polymerase specialized sigma24 family protein